MASLFSRMSTSTRAILRISVLIWAFGYALVSVIAAAQGRAVLPWEFLVQAPLCMAAVGVTMALYSGWQRLERQRPIARWPGIAGAALAAAGVQTGLDFVYTHWFYMLTEGAAPDWNTADLRRVATILIVYAWTFFLMTSLFWAQSQTRRAIQAEAAAQAAQLAALRLQLNPHFLFNTLNAISTLVMAREVDRAERMIDRLSEFLRSSLHTDPAALISLGDELDTVEAYLEIEAARFEGRLDVSFDCPEHLRDALVPGFVLQPLVENAMKYAVAPSMRPVAVTVGARAEQDELVLTVDDDGEPLDPGRRPVGTGVGLSNTRARLTGLYGGGGRLAAGPARPRGYRAEIRLPLSRSSNRAARRSREELSA